jgi:putative CocE/NonD family hydrolase
MQAAERSDISSEEVGVRAETLQIMVRLRRLSLALFGLLCGLAPATPSPYIVDEHLLIHVADGATISAVIVRRADVTIPQPTALQFTIYAQPQVDAQRMEYAADRGYVAVTAYSRGKGDSPDAIAPYEFDGQDAAGVIDWIARQPWSNGQVGMYGGSYNGFTQWAATKWMPRALKTIVPWVAQNPGDGLPMQNNVFLLVNYPWVYYVTDNKLLDDAAYTDPRFKALNDRWYASGVSYRNVDTIAGRSNPWLRKWLDHPSDDAYWQAMLPYKQEFARIDIPVLAITGYYDDGQVSALNFIRDLYAYNPRANGYVVIGPWDHLGTQHAHKDDVLRGYRIDPAGQIDTPKLTFDWFDYVMRGGPKPALLADRINYEVMGANRWAHAPSLDAMSAKTVTFYLSATSAGGRYRLLSRRKPAKLALLRELVDFADRESTHDNDTYPDPIVGKKPDLSRGFAFGTPPLPRAMTLSGSFSGTVRATVNKRDLDFGAVLYQIQSDGQLFELSYFIGRASYARDMSERELLTPGRVTSIPFSGSYVASRFLAKGSRLLLTLDVNKNAFAEIDYGTGAEVADEDIKDAKEPLQVSWLTDSFVRVPLSPE